MSDYQDIFKNISITSSDIDQAVANLGDEARLRILVKDLVGNSEDPAESIRRLCDLSRLFMQAGSDPYSMSPGGGVLDKLGELDEDFGCLKQARFGIQYINFMILIKSLTDMDNKIAGLGFEALFAAITGGQMIEASDEAGTIIDVRTDTKKISLKLLTPSEEAKLEGNTMSLGLDLGLIVAERVKDSNKIELFSRDNKGKIVNIGSYVGGGKSKLEPLNEERTLEMPNPAEARARKEMVIPEEDRLALLSYCKLAVAAMQKRPEVYSDAVIDSYKEAIKFFDGLGGRGNDYDAFETLMSNIKKAGESIIANTEKSSAIRKKEAEKVKTLEKSLISFFEKHQETLERSVIPDEGKVSGGEMGSTGDITDDLFALAGGGPLSEKEVEYLEKLVSKVEDKQARIASLNDKVSHLWWMPIKLVATISKLKDNSQKYSLYFPEYKGKGSVVKDTSIAPDFKTLASLLGYVTRECSDAGLLGDYGDLDLNSVLRNSIFSPELKSLMAIEQEGLWPWLSRTGKEIKAKKPDLEEGEAEKIALDLLMDQTREIEAFVKSFIIALEKQAYKGDFSKYRSNITSLVKKVKDKSLAKRVQKTFLAFNGSEMTYSKYRGPLLYDTGLTNYGKKGVKFDDELYVGYRNTGITRDVDVEDPTNSLGRLIDKGFRKDIATSSLRGKPSDFVSEEVEYIIGLKDTNGDAVFKIDFYRISLTKDSIRDILSIKNEDSKRQYFDSSEEFISWAEQNAGESQSEELTRGLRGRKILLINKESKDSSDSIDKRLGGEGGLLTTKSGEAYLGSLVTGHDALETILDNVFNTNEAMTGTLDVLSEINTAFDGVKRTFYKFSGTLDPLDVKLANDAAKNYGEAVSKYTTNCEKGEE